MIAAGLMRERVTLFTSLPTYNSVGEQVPAWTADATLWAARQSLTLREVNRQAGLQEAVEAKFVIRAREVTTANELEHRGTRYKIVGVEAATDRASVSLLVRRV